MGAAAGGPYCYRCGLPAHRGATEWCDGFRSIPYFYRVHYCDACGAALHATPDHRWWDCPPRRR